MLTIPAAVETLLKSKSMIGENRPMWNVSIQSSSSSFAIEDVREIVIEKQMYQAHVCNVVIDNKDGKYAPDRVGTYEQVLWPNNTITVYLGYTSTEANALAFTGLIDSIQMRHVPSMGAVATVSARDLYKRALDQIVTNPDDGTNTWTFENMTAEDIFMDLAISAGWSSGDVTAQTSDVTVAAKTFERESYADAFLWLCEAAGFETIVENDGKLEYRFAADRQPEIVDEAVTLNSTAWTNLAKTYLVSGSERVFSSTEFGGTEYTSTDDYDIEYGSPARIARQAAGDIGDGNTVYVTYVYAAWSFVMGEDIIQLDYTIDDADVYADVIVLGTGVSATVDCYLEEYWRLLPQKVRVVPVSEIADGAVCTTIGQQVARRSAQRARRVDFACPGNPWLEVGDCIRVEESTTTSSEIYRIVGIEHRLGPEGFVTQLQCYYYGYTPAPEGVV